MRIYPDACVVIAAARGDEADSLEAISLLADPTTEIVASSLLRLEALAPPIRNGFVSQEQAVEAVLAAAEFVPVDERLSAQAFAFARQTKGLDAMDALHAAAAHLADAELVTLERKGQALFRVPGLAVRRL